MAKNSVTDWDETAADNTDIGGISLAENVMRPPAVNNAFREMMAQLVAFFKASVFRIWDNTDTTKLLAFDLSGITTATTRTVTMPDKSGTMAMTDDIPAPMKGHLYGLTLSNNSTDATNDIDIAAGDAASDDSTPVLMTLASALTKRIDAAWTVGTGQGMLDTGSVANTTYYLYLIRRSDTGVVDVLASASSTSPTMPTNYDQKRLIGFFVRASAANLTPHLNGDPVTFTSAEQNITSAGALSLAHGLGNEPEQVTCILACATAEAGYSIGDQVFISATTADNSTNTGVILMRDASALDVRYGSGTNVFYILHKSTGARTALTNANWRLIVKAWA